MKCNLTSTTYFYWNSYFCWNKPDNIALEPGEICQAHSSIQKITHFQFHRNQCVKENEKTFVGRGSKTKGTGAVPYTITSVCTPFPHFPSSYNQHRLGGTDLHSVNMHTTPDRDAASSWECIRCNANRPPPLTDLLMRNVLPGSFNRTRRSPLSCDRFANMRDQIDSTPNQFAPHDTSYKLWARFVEGYG